MGESDLVKITDRRCPHIF